jgi:hypothetical protein
MNNKPFNLEEFFAPYKEFLEKSGPARLNYYKYVIEKLVNLNRPITVVETGTMWSSLEGNMGAFTYVFGDLIKNHTGGKLITIDISEKNINSCKESTKEFSDAIEYVISDSVTYLKSLSDEEVQKIDFIYFDSYDLSVPDPIPSQLHHYRELDAVYNRLSQNVYLAVDDNFLPGGWIEWWTIDNNGDVIDKTRYDVGPHRVLGKGTLIDCFLLCSGWKRNDELLNLGHHHSYILGYERI